MVAGLLSFLGAQVFGMGLLLQLRGPLTGCAAQCLDLHEGVLFWLLAGIAAGIVGGVGFIAWSWVRPGMDSIAYLKFTLFFLFTATVLRSLRISLLYAHLLMVA